MSDIEIATLKARVEFLEQLTEGIMNEPGTGHIQGTNAYEKFCQTMSELNYDEKWITELKAENKELKKENKQTFENFKKKLSSHIYKDIVEKLEDIDYLPPGKISDVVDDITNNWEDNYDEFVEEFIK